MHKTATGTIVAGTGLLVKIVKEGAERGGRRHLKEGFAELGFVFWMTGNGTQFCERMSELTFVPGHVSETHTKTARNIPVSTRPFLFPAPAQFRFEENRFGIVSEIDGTVVVACCGNRNARNRGLGGEVIRRENIEWLREPALTRWDGLGGRGRDRCMTSMKPETNSLRPRMKTTIRAENL
jgi:hypothetical protein